MKLLAHIRKQDGVTVEQSLCEHCVRTACYSSESLKSAGFYHMAYLAGLLHDMGKATKKFNDYLLEASEGNPEARRGSVNHTFAGVVYLLENHHRDTDPPTRKLASEVIAYAIGAHHGLFDGVDLNGNNGFLHRLEKDRGEICYDEAVTNFEKQVADKEELDKLFEDAAEEFGIFYNKLLVEWDRKADRIFSQIGLLVRMLTSAVIYGDRRDTVEFMYDLAFSDASDADWTTEQEYLEKQLSQFDLSSELNRVRGEISAQCLAASHRSTGVYRLNVPTGGGKTLSSLRYALSHAKIFHKKRIIFIIPLLSVLDQNAKVIREYIQNQSLVLEHHSNIIQEKESNEDSGELDMYELMTENWNSPIIVSTLVQLLNILFTHKTSAIGRMRALCDSVIVIDEVQSIPKKTIAMFNMAIDFLSSYCNATVVLSSATQPCLEELDPPIKLADQPDLVRLKPQESEVFERAEILDMTNEYGMDMEEWVQFCTSRMELHQSMLVICNTKREARNLFLKLSGQAEEEGWYICHLSTSMCQKHREDTLKELQDKLKMLQRGENGALRIVCISTQLVEAGVDFSFECVVRVTAGIDNLAQAAGRCNRSNEYGKKGKVCLVNLKNENLSMLKEIADAQNSTLNVLTALKQADDGNLIGEQATRLFYQYLFREKSMQRVMRYPVKDGTSELFLADLLANRNPYVKKTDPMFLHQPFQTCGKEFQVFEDQTIDVLVPYKDGKDLIEKLREEQDRYHPASLRNILQQTKRFTINIYQWQKKKLWEDGMLTELFEGRLYILDEKAYDEEKYGLVEQTERPVDDFIL